MGKRKLTTISTKTKTPDSMDSVRNWVGKHVISKSGDVIGKVQDFKFLKNTITGIVVMKKLSRIYLGIEFVSAVSQDSVMLSIDPVTMLIGKKVFDVDGKDMGKLVQLVRKGNNNSFEAIIVKRKFYSKGIKIPKADVEISKKNLILKKAYE